MTWFGWVLLAYFTVGALGSVLLIGRRRDPITPGVAVWTIVCYGLLVWGVVAVGTGAL